MVLRAPRSSDIDDLREIGRRPEIVRAYGSTPDGSDFGAEELEEWYGSPTTSTPGSSSTRAVG